MKAATYTLGGLRIVSDFPLFGLQVCRNEDDVPSEVLLRYAPIPDTTFSITAKFRHSQYSEKSNGREILLEFPGVGRFLLRAGKEILMDLAPSSDDDEVRAYLLGAV